MTETALRSVVERHSCELFGTRYSLRLEWAAFENCPRDASPRCVLRIEYTSTSDTVRAPMQLHLLVSVTDISELPALLDDALQHSLMPEEVVTAPDRPWADAVSHWLAAVVTGAWYQTRRGSRIAH